MNERSGGCLCGKVRFTLSSEPVATAICHCRNCQKTAGSAFSVVVLALATSFSVEGAPATYVDTGDSGGNVERSFCANCGSPIVSRAATMTAQGLLAIKASAFDDVTWLKPSVQIYCDSEQPWVSTLATLPRVAKSPS